MIKEILGHVRAGKTLINLHICSLIRVLPALMNDLSVPRRLETEKLRLRLVCEGAQAYQNHMS